MDYIDVLLKSGALKPLEERISDAVKSLNSEMQAEFNACIDINESGFFKEIMWEMTSSHIYTSGDLEWENSRHIVGWVHTGNCVGDESCYWDKDLCEIYCSDIDNLKSFAYKRMFNESLKIAKRLEQERQGLQKVLEKIKKYEHKKEEILKKIKSLI